MRTADEMFKELGYTKMNAHANIYKRGEDKVEVEERIVACFDGVEPYFECLVDGEKEGFFGSEILACAQLIKEMEENKNA